MEHVSDISIVGAGITGLSCAISLQEAPECRGLTIRVFDSQPEVGGRIHSRPLWNGQAVELGAGRFSPSLHPLLAKVVRQHRQVSAHYPFTQPARPTETQQQLKATLHGLASALDTHGKQPFLSLARTLLGERRASQLVSDLGYDALRLPTISAKSAFDIIGTHPETQGFSAYPEHSWCYAPHGLAWLTNTLRRQAEAGGVRFHTGTRLSQLGHRDGRHQLYFTDTAHGAGSQHDCRHLVLALPPSAMTSLETGFPARWSPYRYGSLPLFKGFLFYAEPWWKPLGLADRFLIVDNPLRKIYFVGDSHIWFYTDSDTADYWRDIIACGESRYLGTVRRFLGQALQQADTRQPLPQQHQSRYWPHGVEFCIDDVADHPPALLEKDHGIIAASDAYTSLCGWMEGGLISGQAAAGLLLERLRHPSTLTADPR